MNTLLIWPAKVQIILTILKNKGQNSLKIMIIANLAAF